MTNNHNPRPLSPIEHLVIARLMDRHLDGAYTKTMSEMSSALARNWNPSNPLKEWDIQPSRRERRANRRALRRANRAHNRALRRANGARRH